MLQFEGKFKQKAKTRKDRLKKFSLAFSPTSVALPACSTYISWLTEDHPRLAAQPCDDASNRENPKSVFSNTEIAPLASRGKYGERRRNCCHLSTTHRARRQLDPQICASEEVLL